jgi:hypothetical protein
LSSRNILIILLADLLILPPLVPGINMLSLES